MSIIYTIGHSSRDLAEFSHVLQQHEVELVVDIRAFPMSRRFPHFNREHLELWLPEIGCDYLWEPDLGGRRKKQMPPGESPNVALRNPSFRNYADYMLSQQFGSAAQQLVERGSRTATAIVCSEYIYFRCHRMLVSDYLLAQGHTVMHILDDKTPKQHALSKDARILEGRLVYRGDFLL